MSGFDSGGPGDNPFGGELQRMIAAMGGMLGGAMPIGLAGARQIAASVAGRPENNIDPAVRSTFEQLSRVAELHVAEFFGRPVDASGRNVVVVPHNRMGWIDVALRELATLFSSLSDAMGVAVTEQLRDLTELADQGDDPDVAAALGAAGLGADMAAMLAQLGQTLAPVMSQMMSGSTLGHLATRSFGTYDLPLPRERSAPELTLILTNIDDFARDWEIDASDLHLWVCISEMAHHAVIGHPTMAGRLQGLLTRHAQGFESMGSSDDISERLDLDLDPDPARQLEALFTDPTRLLGALRTESQRVAVDEIHQLVTVGVGLAEHATDRIAARLLAKPAALSEALRRRRVETDEATHFVEQLFGMHLDFEQLELGRRFAAGVVDRSDPNTLSRAWTEPDALPTPNELRAPGVWLSRLGIEPRTPDEADLDGIEIPDYPDLDS